MDPFLFRIIRSIVMAIIMLFSVKAFGFPASAATIAALIPLLLGVVDVMAPTAWGITALIFILAATVHVLPEQYEFLKKQAGFCLPEAPMKGGAPTPQESSSTTNSVPGKQ